MEESRQEQREKRRLKERAKMLKHGASLRRVYRDAVAKRVRIQRSTKGQTG